MDTSTKQRIAMNEATFRAINEGVRGGPQQTRSFLCECGRLGCNKVIRLSVAAYEAVRVNPRRFFVVPGHEIPEVEDVVQRHDDYAVIEKHADAADVVERTDPRHPLDD